MNKQQIFFLLLNLILLPFAALSGESAINDSGIALEGEFRTGGFRSGGDAVTAEVQGSTIIATFHKNLGNVSITITNGSGGIVYEAMVDTSIQPQVFISLTGLPQGIYIINFSNGLGSMYGDFEV
ncbi:MAG: DUF3244 domain-containing protein [Porphyromonadaceae bacterium]|nr:DUF3244 domain-containing protein [Porphyromonadaceae bacterium]